MNKFIRLTAICLTAFLLSPARSVYGGSMQIMASLSVAEQEYRKPEASSADFGEYTALKLNEIIQQATRTGSLVIVISRLGSMDTRANLHNRRLHNAVTRLTGHSEELALPIEQVVIARGDRIEGNGRVELYVEGRLNYIVVFRPNADFRVDCCDEDSRYYPWYKELRKRGKLRRGAS